MDTIQNRIEAFVKLGTFLDDFSNKMNKKELFSNTDLFFNGMQHQLKIAQENNGWFTQKNILFSLKNWGKALTENNIKKWITKENISKNSSKKVAIIMAGNIPLVGFHDFLSVLISGHSVVVKQASNDKHLLPYLAKYLEYIAPFFKGKISFTEEKLPYFDAVIATGSNNTARYFEYYFKNKPHIIRKNRNSVAVLTGNENEQDLQNLSEDIFSYFGLGCRSVSKLFIPKDYNFDAFFKAMYSKKEIINNLKYANNYDYNKAVYLMSEFNILENGFLMLKEDTSYASPIASVFYEYYENIAPLKNKLQQDKEQIQCIVSKDFIKNEIAFGKTQQPQLWDYADQVNTLSFLAKI